MKVATALEDMPATREALSDGEVSSSAVRVLVGAKEAHPAEFAGAEGDLVEAARDLPARVLQSKVSAWRQELDLARAWEESERLR